ncbi:hypothetical protein KC622_03115 [Candidatus Dojkabacteria bacterium]|uniref:Uncharacterized protein n=1 Tax=Candidatus Dojkabacteria bacterium TaxID=2099670 RepID=A0A955HXP2_9BACT|nr:hypothetical protein [Candidatus Dojkabacteria bacterium]
MTAPKAKKTEENEKGVQLIVFSPINSDLEDEDSFIYMVCPSSLKVVEVIEKTGDDAEEYLALLNKKKVRSSVSPKTFIEELGNTPEVESGLLENNSSPSLDEELSENVASLEDEVDEDIITYASEALTDIFPDDSGSDDHQSDVSDVDMAEALALLDADSDADFPDLNDFKDDDDNLPEL